MLIVLDNRFPSEDFEGVIFAAVQNILRRHAPDTRLVPGLVRMVQKRTRPHAPQPDARGCCAVQHAVLRVCSIEQLSLVADSLVQYALVHLGMRVAAAPGDVLRLLVYMLNRVHRARTRVYIGTQCLPTLLGALAQLANTWTQDIHYRRANDRYLLVDALTRLLCMGVECPVEDMLHLQGLCVGMLTLRPCKILLKKVKRLLLHVCPSPQSFPLKETLVARLLRINTRDARIRREILEILCHVIQCNGKRCLCTNFTEGVCQQVLLYCINTTPVPEASALCSYDNAAIVSIILNCAMHGQHKRGAHSATRAQTLAFIAQLPPPVCKDLCLERHLVELL